MGKLICGKNTVLEAVKNKVDILVIYTSRPNEIKDTQIEVIVKDNFQLDKMVNSNHQGFVAELKTFNYFSLETIFKDLPQKILILDHIEDPHNLGAIIRTANAAGIKHIILPKDRAAKMSPTVSKIAAGGTVGIKMIIVSSIMNAIQKLKKHNFWIYASSLKNAVPLKNANFNYPLAMIVGNENKGVSQAVLKHTDENIFIPMHGSVQSLNVSVATGILLFAI